MVSDRQGLPKSPPNNAKPAFGVRKSSSYGRSAKWLPTQGQLTPHANPRIRLALLTARRTAPHCLREPSLRELMMRSSVGICPLA